MRYERVDLLLTLTLALLKSSARFFYLFFACRNSAPSPRPPQVIDEEDLLEELLSKLRRRRRQAASDEEIGSIEEERLQVRARLASLRSVKLAELKGEKRKKQLAFVACNADTGSILCKNVLRGFRFDDGAGTARGWSPNYSC